MLFVVGGIYTVIRTKAAVTAEELGDRYFLIGPYNESCVRTELDIMEPPNEAVARSFQQMREHGLKVCFEHALLICFFDFFVYGYVLFFLPVTFFACHRSFLNNYQTEREHCRTFEKELGSDRQ